MKIWLSKLNSISLQEQDNMPEGKKKKQNTYTHKYRSNNYYFKKWAKTFLHSAHYKITPGKKQNNLPTSPNSSCRAMELTKFKMTGDGEF